jgi:hypothetical protein
VPRGVVPELCVVGDSEENRIELRVMRGAEPSLRRLAELPPDAVIALLPSLDPEADGLLCWEPGQAAPLGITPPDSEGALLAGCFVVFVPAQPDDGGLMLEDGYAVKLTAASWQAVRDALINGRDLDLPARGAMALRVVWLDDAYVAADGQTLVAPRGWNVYRPAAPASGPDGSEHERVHLLEVRLLTAQAELVTRVAPRDVAVFCREIQQCAEHALELSHRGEATPADLQTFYEAVRALAKLPVRDGEVGFEVFLAVDPDAAASQEPT